MQNVSDIIEALGGTGQVARSLGVRPQAVANMKARGSIPAEHWRRLVEAAQQLGRHEITLEMFAELASQRRESRKAVA